MFTDLKSKKFWHGYAQPYNYLSSYFRFNSYIYKSALFTPTKVANKKIHPVKTCYNGGY